MCSVPDGASLWLLEDMAVAFLFATRKSSCHIKSANQETNGLWTRERHHAPQR
jgi:hypothetical protein